MKRAWLHRLFSIFPAALLLLSAQISPASALNSLPVYLIIAPVEFEEALGDFVDLKTSQGFQTEVALLPESGSTKEQIKGIIQTHEPPPKYVLLVGDLDKIPSWPVTTSFETGSCPGNKPCTDLYYTTIDGDSDFIPNVILGRLPVQDATQLTALVNKYRAFAQAPLDAPWRKKISFIAYDQIDNYEKFEDNHDLVIAEWTARYGFYGTFDGIEVPTAGGDRLYPQTYSAGKQDLLDAVNDGRMMVVYSGSGTSTEWTWKMDQFLTTVDAAGLTGPPVPLVLALADLTAEISSQTSMAEAWINHPTGGALVYIGSGFDKYEEPDLYLETLFFDALFSNPGSMEGVGEIFYSTLEKFSVFNLYNESIVKQYWEAYQILGDPSLRIPLYPYRIYLPMAAKLGSG